MKKTSLILATMAAALLATGAQAAEFGARNVAQEQRIEQGLRAGTLSSFEAADLMRRADDIYRMQGNVLADGRLNGRERATVDRAQDALDAEIQRQWHDRERANPHAAPSRRMLGEASHRVAQQQQFDRRGGDRHGDRHRDHGDRHGNHGDRNWDHADRHVHRTQPLPVKNWNRPEPEPDPDPRPYHQKYPY
jgi:hypothetical protein